MTTSDRRQALADLLRTRRERLDPAELGLPVGSRRRTPGLRREEVAELAHVSTTYYTYLEQARPVRPSAQVLDAIGDALRLTPAERSHLGELAADPAPTGAPEHLPAGVARLVETLEPAPTVVKGRAWDVLAANAAARELFGDWGTGEPNLVTWMLTDPAAREVYGEWESEARAMLGRFRVAAARHPDDARVGQVKASILADQQAARWWAGHPVAARESGSKLLRHPTRGMTTYHHVVLVLADDPDLTLVTYRADD